MTARRPKMFVLSLVLLLLFFIIMWMVLGPAWISKQIFVPGEPTQAPTYQGHMQDLSKTPFQVKSDEAKMDYLRNHGRQNGGLPSEEELKKMSGEEIHTIYHSYLDNVQTLCHLSLRMGRFVDGGYEVCDDEKYRPRKPCIVYSFGIRDDFSFDDDVARLYGCHVHSFDPNMKAENHRRSDKVTFYKIGLGGRNGQLEPGLGAKTWKTESFSDIKSKLGHQNQTLDIVKLDIEVSEWISLADMADAGELRKIRQLIVEFHLLGGGEDARLVRRRLPVLRRIEQAGFRIFHTHVFPAVGIFPPLRGVYPVLRTLFYEVSFVNKNLSG